MAGKADSATISHDSDNANYNGERARAAGQNDERKLIVPGEKTPRLAFRLSGAGGLGAVAFSLRLTAFDYFTAIHDCNGEPENNGERDCNFWWNVVYQFVPLVVVVAFSLQDCRRAT